MLQPVTCKSLFGICLLSLVLFSLASCDEKAKTVKAESNTITQSITLQEGLDGGNPIARKADGSILTEEDIEEIDKFGKKNPGTSIPIEFVGPSFKSTDSETSSDKRGLLLYNKVSNGIRTVVSLSYGYVGECIKRDCWHFSIVTTLEVTKHLISDVHLCGWHDSQGNKWYGIYSSGDIKMCYNSQASYGKIWSSLDNWAKMVPINSIVRSAMVTMIACAAWYTFQALLFAPLLV